MIKTIKDRISKIVETGNLDELADVMSALDGVETKLNELDTRVSDLTTTNQRLFLRVTGNTKEEDKEPEYDPLSDAIKYFKGE